MSLGRMFYSALSDYLRNDTWAAYGGVAMFLVTIVSVITQM